MRNMIDYLEYVGKKINRLTILDFGPDKIRKDGSKRRTYECLCECGNKIVAEAYNVITGVTKSCGCLSKERIREMGQSNIKHGGISKHAPYEYYRLYKRWELMKSRCNNPNNRQYNNYGGRGIGVCDEWNNSFDNFKNWALQNGYSIDLTLDRIDVNGDYEPNNCRWTDMKTQSNNKRNNVHLIIDGEDHTVSEWAEISNRSARSIFYRIYKGNFTDKEAVFPELSSRKEITFNNQTHSIAEWSKITGITASAIRNRLKSGWGVKAILTTPMASYRTITVNGEEHGIYEWAKLLGVTPRTIYLRLKNGWSEQAAVTTPRGESPSD